MLHPKKLNRKQKEFLKDIGLNPKDFFRERTCPECYIFIQKSTGKLVSIRR